MTGALAYLSPFGIAGIAIATLFVAQEQGMGEDANPRAAFARPVEALAAEPGSAPSGSSHSVTVERSRDGMFYVNAEINGESIRFLVDSGASVAVLTDADARRIGVQREPVDGQMDTVGGQVPMSWTTVKQIRIGERRLPYVRAAIVNGSAGVSLIGQNVLTRFSSITIKGDHMRLD